MDPGHGHVACAGSAVREGTSNDSGSITGFGSFAERAEVDGFPYYNTSLSGKGSQYPDPHSKFLTGEDSYILLTVERDEKMTVEIKSLHGEVRDRKEYLRK